MNEQIATAPQPEASLWQTTMKPIISRVAAGGVIATAALLPPTFGAIHEMQKPEVLHIAPGIDPEVALHFGPDSQINFGPLGHATLHDMHASAPLIGDVGLQVSFNRNPIKIATDRESLALYAALTPKDQGTMQTLKDTVVAQKRSAALKGVSEGLGIDLVAGSLVGVSMLAKRRRDVRHDVRDSTFANLADTVRDQQLTYRSVPDALKEAALVLDAHDAPRMYHRPTRIALTAAAALLVTGIPLLHQEIAPKSLGSADEIPLSPSVTAALPLLKRTTVTPESGAALALNTTTTMVTNYIKKTDAYYAGVHDEITAAFARPNTQQDALLLDPTIKRVTIVSDLHCNQAVFSKMMPTILRDMGTDILVDAGDTHVSTGTLPFEADCIKKFGAALDPKHYNGKTIQAVTAQGNHDSAVTAKQERAVTLTDTSGKRYHPFNPLDAKSGYKVTVDGLTFVGSPDPRKSIMNQGTLPSSGTDQEKAVLQQGADLRKIACNETRETGKAPLIVTHDRRAAFAAIVQDCVSTAVSGHTHVQKNLEKYDAAYLFTQGTSSGAGEGDFTEYAPITKHEGAPWTTLYVDIRTNQPVAYQNLLIKKSGKVALSFTQVSKANQQVQARLR